MALKPCRECAAQVSTEAAACPKCGATNPTGEYQVAPAEKKPITVGCLGTSVVIVVVLLIVGSLASDDNTPSSAATSSSTPLERDAKAAAVLAVSLKRNIRNPDSFSISNAIRMPDGSLCLEYRAQNGFGGMNRETAYIAAGEMFFGPEAGYTKGWNQHCAGKQGEDITDKVQSYARVIDRSN